jgi:hypothetical protein
MIEKELALTPDFPPVDYDQWRARVEAAGRSGLMTAADGAESVIRAIGLGWTIPCSERPPGRCPLPERERRMNETKVTRVRSWVFRPAIGGTSR